MKNRKVIPEGTRDLVFQECRKRNRIISILEKTYDSFGYDKVITPTIEYYKTFFNGKEELKEEEVYKFFDSNGKILLLRPDMTIPIGRVIGTKMRDVKDAIRLRYSANVFRVNKTFGGKRNEYTDCGIELVGVKGLEGDVEALVIALESLENLKLENFKFEIGNIKFFNSAFKGIGLEQGEKEHLANLIESKSLIELEEFVSRLNIKEEYKKFFIKLPWLFGDKEVLDLGLDLAFNEEIKASLNYMKKIYSVLESLGYGENITFDLGMMPRVNYYTGIIFKGYADNAGDTILSGGRYDNLIGNFGNSLEAIGFSVNVDLVADSISDREESEFIIVNYRVGEIVQAIQEAKRLKAKGKRVKLSLKGGSSNDN